jgi:hypothetical protein
MAASAASMVFRNLMARILPVVAYRGGYGRGFAAAARSPIIRVQDGGRQAGYRRIIPMTVIAIFKASQDVGR